MKSDRERLLDILEAIERIERHTTCSRDVFDRDELLQTWVVHHIQIIGEASRKLSDTFRTEHSEVPWPQIIAMRNILVHDYFGIDEEEVWNAVQRDIPELKQKVELALMNLNDKG